MKFYRRLQPFTAISFDLDDTLYDNHPIIRRAEQSLIDYINQSFALHTDKAFWRGCKRHALALAPELKHDVTAWRQQGLAIGLNELAIPPEAIKPFIPQAMHHFLVQRSQITLSRVNQELLQSLRRHVRLIAISNGNIDPKLSGLAPYFDHFYFAGKGRKQKPDNQLFHLALTQLQITPQALLHIGDSLAADVAGANHSGCQSLWFNPNEQQLTLSQMPTGEINNLSELATLFCH